MKTKNIANPPSIDGIFNQSDFFVSKAKGISINNFSFIYFEDYLTEIFDSLKFLNKYLNKKFNINLEINKLSNYYIERKNEIIIGNIRNDVKCYYSTLKNNEIIIKIITNNDSTKIIVGGNDKNNTLFAINEFINLINNEEIFNSITKDIYPNYEKIIDLSDIYLSNNELNKYKFICNSNCDDIIKSALTNFAKDLSKIINNSVEISYCDNIDDNIENAFYFGFVDTHINRLPINTYKILSKHLLNKGKYLISGTSNQEILYAIQYLYKSSVINSTLKIPKYISKEHTSVILRDPCILPYKGVYYMYSSNNKGYIVRTSVDLLNWSSEKIIFDKNDSKYFTGIGDFWAPECHYYKGNFYLFATYKSSLNNHRGCAIFKSKTPDGKFEEITNGHITPDNWDAIDGTLYIDKNGKPYMVFVHEWTSTEDKNGLMCYAPLSDDFTRFTKEPQTMFKSIDPKWTNECVTDGPWLHRLENGTLLMIWSNFKNSNFSGYTIGIAKSLNGEIDGPWVHYDEPLYWDDNSNIYKVINGGHGMIFKGFDNRIYLSLHGPNDNDNYHNYFYKLMLIPLIEDLENDTLKIDVL